MPPPIPTPPAPSTTPLNRKIQADLDLAKQMQIKPIWMAKSHVAARKNFESQPWAKREPIHSVTDISIPVTSPPATITARVYRPRPHEPAADPLPVYVYFHGGGWVVGSTHTHDAPPARYANVVGCVVVSVNYRLAPEYAYPIPFHDCLQSVEWVYDNAAHLGVDKTRIAVGGDSAGGNLAAAVALALGEPGSRVRICHQTLIY
ncbi:hypothetical protein HDU93_001184, partial [Gonapodya sp. JEL0774]